MRNEITILVGGVFVMVIGTAGPAWGDGCVQQPPEADTVATIDAVAACGNVVGHVGCRINSGQSSCTYDTGAGMATATVEVGAVGSPGPISWASDGAVDIAIAGGATGANNCAYIFSHDAFVGNGEGFKKSNGQFQNVKFLDICTDQTPEPEQVSQELAPCPADVQAALNDGTIKADVAVTWEIGETPNTALCVKNSFAVTPCINAVLEPGTNTSGFPLCNELDIDDDGDLDPLPFTAITTFESIDLGENTCKLVCPSTNYSTGGSSTCYRIETTTGKRC